MARPRTKNDPIAAEIKWDDTQKRWHAAAPGADGKPIVLVTRTSTKALRGISKELQRNYGRPVVVEPKFHIPKPIASEYNEFSKKHQIYLELKEYVEHKRLELASRLVYDYRMSVSGVGPLVGLSGQRLGVMLDDYEQSMGMPKRAAPNDDEDDEDED